jgi:hypothetical protein
MSMTSKVNPALQKAIVDFLTARPNQNITNNQLYFGLPIFPSLRTVQEATQKLTKAGILASSQRGTYRLAYTTSGASAVATVGAVGI